MANDGDVDGMQQLFSMRQASPFDRDEGGWTLLDVSLCEMMLITCSYCVDGSILRQIRSLPFTY